jgi:sialidase-1
MANIYTSTLFTSGRDDYACYRIPALEVSSEGTILAFCEGRRYSCSDSGQIDLLLRRSTNHGADFDKPIVVATQDGWVCGNPAPVLDKSTGTLWLIFCKNLQDGDEGMIIEGKAPRTVWKTHSTDDGLTWTEPREITDDVKEPSWSWYATGPCHGIQLSSGRLVIPCDHIVKKNFSRDDPYHSHIIYSDDHGETWEIGGSADEGTNESVILQTADNRLYFNCRNKRISELPDGGNFRAVAWSNDGGNSFSPIVHDGSLPEPICEASVCRYGAAQGSHVLFSNPAARDGRYNMTIRLSNDECRTWPVSKVLYEGPAAYSDLCVAADGTILCMYERGLSSPYEGIELARFNIDWLTTADTLS